MAGGTGSHRPPHQQHLIRSATREVSEQAGRGSSRLNSWRESRHSTGHVHCSALPVPCRRPAGTTPRASRNFWGTTTYGGVLHTFAEGYGVTTPQRSSVLQMALLESRNLTGRRGTEQVLYVRPWETLPNRKPGDRSVSLWHRSQSNPLSSWMPLSKISFAVYQSCTNFIDHIPGLDQFEHIVPPDALASLSSGYFGTASHLITHPRSAQILPGRAEAWSGETVRSSPMPLDPSAAKRIRLTGRGSSLTISTEQGACRVTCVETLLEHKLVECVQPATPDCHDAVPARRLIQESWDPLAPLRRTFPLGLQPSGPSLRDGQSSSSSIRLIFPG